MAATPSTDRLVAVIELQNAIAAAAMTADEVMGIVVERARALTAGAGGAIALVEGDDIAYRAVTSPTRLAIGTRLARATSVAGRCVAERQPLRVEDAAADARAGGDGHVRTGSIACVPLLYGEAAVGTLEVTSERTAAFSDQDVETLRLLAQIVAIALHRAYTYPRPRYDSEHDALTALGNRRAFDDRIQAELTRNKRYRHSFSLAMLDLGGLETAVDRLGQAAGDEALREVASILKRHTRAIDGCFRVGADDFAIVMPGTSLDGAQTVAERCRAQIAEARLCDGALTASVGTVEALDDETADLLVARGVAAVTADKHAHRA